MDPMKDYGYELVRRELLAAYAKSAAPLAANNTLIERNYLFPEVFKEIKALQHKAVTDDVFRKS